MVSIPVAEGGAKFNLAVNGQPLVRAGEPVGHSPDVKYQGQQAGYFRFTVPAGEWIFERTLNDGG
jgi:hypothetical protein